MINNSAKSQITKIKVECEKRKPVVVIFSLIFNHGPYLKDYFEGILSQKTDFPFIVILHDDASTDESREIIAEYASKYPEIIKPIYEDENQYSKKNGEIERILDKAIDASGAQYVALCEGDDYWIDPLKLQKQVNFLNNNPDYGMVHTNVKEVSWESDFKKVFEVSKNTYEGDVYNNLLSENFIHTLTVLFRREFIEVFKKEIYPLNYLDRIMWTCISLHSKIHYFPEVTGVYRILRNSATHGKYEKKLNFYKECTDNIIEFLKKNNRPNYEIETFCLPRYRVLLRNSFMAADRDKTKFYWKLIEQKSKPKFLESLLWVFHKLHISPKIIEIILKTKSKLKGLIG